MEKPKRFLRGKKTRLKNFTEHFTKVPNCILYAKNVTVVEKLILMGLQSYSQRSNWILAYTRLALELHVDKSNLIDRWKLLKERGIIIEEPEYYSINYDLLTDEVAISNPEVGSLNPPKPIDQPKDKSVGKTNQPTKTGSPTPLESSSVCPPAKVGESHPIGGAIPAIEEENKEKEEESKNNDEEEFLKLMEKYFPEEEEMENNLYEVLTKNVDEDELRYIASNSLSEFLKASKVNSNDKYYESLIGVHSRIQRQYGLKNELVVEKPNQYKPTKKEIADAYNDLPSN